MSFSVADLGTILGVWAHPDDEAFGSAGLMAAARDNGQRVAVVTATLGEHGTPDAQAWPPERLATVRRHELAASLAALGVTEHHLLGYPDGTLAQQRARRAVGRIARIVADVRPDTIVTFGPDGLTGHADHQTVSAWARAVRDAAAPGARLLHTTTTDVFADRWSHVHERLDVFLADGLPLRTPVADLAVHLRLTPAQSDRKLVALRAHASQTTGMLTALGEDLLRDWWSVETFVDGDRTPEVEPAWGTWHLVV